MNALIENTALSLKKKEPLDSLTEIEWKDAQGIASESEAEVMADPGYWLHRWLEANGQIFPDRQG